MKKAVVIILSIIIAVSLIGFVAWRIFVNVAGGFVINKLVEDTIAQLEQSLNEVENLDALLGQVETAVGEQPVEEPVNEEVVIQQEEPVAVEPSSSVSENTVVNSQNTNNSQPKKQNQGNVQQPEPLNSQPSVESNTNKPDDKENSDDSVGSKLNMITYEDKSAAIKMLKNKFTVSEIMYYQDKVFNGGINAELIKEVKAVLKSRCTKEEIEQLKEWYKKYK